MRGERRPPPEQWVRDVIVGGEPPNPNRTYTIAVQDFVVLGDDGYGMFQRQQVLIGHESGGLMLVALENYVVAWGEIAPEIDGRIVISR